MVSRPSKSLRAGWECTGQDSGACVESGEKLNVDIMMYHVALGR